VPDARTPTGLTLTEFLAWEELQEGRHEFIDGEVVSLGGSTIVHSLICVSIMAALSGQLRGLEWTVLAVNAQVLVGQNICYPDVLVAHKLDLAGSQVKEPMLLAEVLSPETERYDRGLKWQSYQDRLPSLRTFLLIAQDRVSVEVFRRGEQGWLYSSHTRLEEVLELSDPPCRLKLAEIYEDVLDRLGPGGV